MISLSKRIRYLRKKRQCQKARPSTLFAKRFLKKVDVAVEVGVRSGSNALSILGELRPKKMFLVDKYWLDEKDAFVRADHRKCYAKAQKRLEFFDNITFLVETSQKAIEKVPGQLDFVYIDGDHSYYGAADDISRWVSKVRSGGILAGHDYDNKHPDVKKAVQALLKEYKIFHNKSDWWIVV